MLASYNGQLDTTRVLLEHGGDPQLANDMGQIPLAGAAFKGDTEMTRLLIEHGADVNARMPDGKTALMFAAMFNRAPRLLICCWNTARTLLRRQTMVRRHTV